MIHFIKTIIMKNILFFFYLLLMIACKADFLETVNPNAPDLATTLANPDDWEAIIERQFNVVWQANQNRATSIALAGMADVATSSWNSFGMLIYTSEPRRAIINEEGWGFVEFPYYENFKVIGSVNDILRLLNENPTIQILDANGIDIRKKLTSAAIFLRGMAYGNLALRYDKAQYIDEQTDISIAAAVAFEDYQTLMTKAIADLEKAITIAETSADFSMAYFNGLSLTKSTYLQLIRTLQAKYKAHVSRNSAENEANDWQTILNYAQAGIKEDILLVGDGGDWFDDFKSLLIHSPQGFARIDYRVIAAMAENTPSRFPEDDSHPLPEPKAIDQRLLTDMTYREDIAYLAIRGFYHFSHYAYSRYQHLSGAGTGPIPWILKAENDLLLAEAMIQTGTNKSAAAALINNTRVGRGGLSELSGNESDTVLLDAILHEQLIELLATNGAQPFYDRRRRPDDDGSFHPYTGLQIGTPRQFPVPAKELGVLGMTVYTFGGN